MKRVVAAGALASCLIVACTKSDDATCAACDANDASADSNVPPGDGGVDGTVAVPPGCDPSAEPKDAPNCVVSDYGIFVDGTTGSDTNSGTKELPVKTIANALTKLGGRPRIYVCEGTYPESVKLTSAVSIFGGFACTTWQYTGNRPQLAPTVGSAALEIAGVSSTFRIVDLSFTGPPAAQAANRSSIGIFVHQSKVDFIRIDVSALEGADGANATVASNYDPALQPDDPKLLGKTASGTTGGAQQDCLGLCTNNVHSTGGKGGQGGDNPAAGMPSAGEAGKPDRGGGLAGAPNAMCLSVGAGGNGGAGNPGQAGADGDATSVLGKLTDEGWSPNDGAAAGFGGPGQGGGGGGGNQSASNGAGGGGGCGGCGGAPGGAASGGGASVGILILNSLVALTDTTLLTKRAGNGGAGIAGQDGQVGGFAGTQSPGGCLAGAGGKGGKGGASAGGAGGVSAGLVYRGDKPTMQNVKITPGAKGSKGTGGIPGTNDGPEGVSAETHEVVP